MGDETAWLTKLEQEPWYSQVELQFAHAGVADPVWQATLLNEDGSLNPAVVVYDPDSAGNPGYSYGLFQLRQPGVGSGYATSTLQDPVQNAAIAANKMGKALAASGQTIATPPSQQLQTVELAGWNGSLTQDPTRQAQLSDVIAASGGATPAGGVMGGKGLINPGGSARLPNDPTQYANGSTQAADAIGSALGIPSSAQISSWLTNALIGAVLLAILAGGFALMASSSTSTNVQINGKDAAALADAAA